MDDADLRGLGPRRIDLRAGRRLLGAAVCLGFAAIGFGLWVAGERVFSTLLLVIFAPVSGIAVAQLVKPPTMWLNQQGFTYYRPPFGTQSETWGEVGEFAVWAHPRQPTVVYDSPTFAKAHPFWAWVNRVSVKRNAAIHVGMGGISAYELCVLLARYREAYGGHRVTRPEADPV